MSWYLYVTCAAIVAAVSAFLVADHDYEDGVVGRAALSILAIVHSVILMGAMFEETRCQVLPETWLTEVGIALFLVRHLYRFMRWKCDGTYAWRPARK